MTQAEFDETYFFCPEGDILRRQKLGEIWIDVKAIRLDHWLNGKGRYRVRLAWAETPQGHWDCQWHCQTKEQAQEYRDHLIDVLALDLIEPDPVSPEKPKLPENTHTPASQLL